MSNFFVQLFGKSFMGDLANSTATNGLDAVFKNPVIKSMAKSYRKEIQEALIFGEQDLIRLIESLELLPGETQAAPIIDIDFDSEGNKEIRLIVAAFEDTKLTRVITDTPLRQFLTNWYNQKLK